MSEMGGIGSFGIFPFLSEDLIKQAKYANIRTRAGKMAYLMTMGENAQKPKVEDGVEKAKGALKWIKSFAEEDKS